MKEARSVIEDVSRRILRKGEVEVNKAMTFSWDDLSSESISIHYEPNEDLGIREKAALWFEGLNILRERLREARRTDKGELAKVRQINATSWIVKTNPGYLTREGFRIGGPAGVPDTLQMSEKLLDLYDKKRTLLRPEHRDLDPMFAWISVEDFVDELGNWGSRAERANARTLVGLEEKSPVGEEYPKDVVCLHATSVEVLEELLKGRIPGRTYETPEHKLGDLFVYPLAERLGTDDVSADVLEGVPYEEQATRDDIAHYANLQAERHYVLSKLGHFDDPKSLSEALVIFDELLLGTTPATLDDDAERMKMEALLEKHGEENVAHLVAEAKQRKGVILGVKRSALKKFPVELGDPGDGDLKLVTGKQGLVLADIGMVQILGPDGKAFFDDLRRRL